MAGETIRDVIIRTRIQMVGSDPMRAAAADAKKYTDAVKQGTQATTQTATAVNRAAEIERKWLLEAIRQRERLIKAEQQLRAEVERRAAAEAKAVPAGGAVAGQPAAAAAKPGFFPGIGAALTISSAVLTVLNAPKVVLGGITEGIKGITADIKGGVEAAEAGLFTKVGNEFYKALDEALTAIGLPGKKGTAFDQHFKNPDAINQVTPADLMKQVRDLEIERLRMSLDLQNKLRSTEENRIKAQLDASKEATKEAQSRLDAHKKSIESAKEEFGLFNVRQKQNAIAIAEKIGQRGIGSLNEAELDFAQKTQAFRGLLKDESIKNADASGFGRILAGIGQEGRTAALEAEVRATIDQQNAITINVEASDKIIRDIEEKLEPMLDKVQKDAARAIEQAIQKADAKRRGVVLPNL